MPDEQKEVQTAIEQRQSAPNWNKGQASPTIHRLSQKYGPWRAIKDLLRSK